MAWTLPPKELDFVHTPHKSAGWDLGEQVMAILQEDPELRAFTPHKRVSRDLIRKYTAHLATYAEIESLDDKGCLSCVFINTEENRITRSKVEIKSKELVNIKSQTMYIQRITDVALSKIHLREIVVVVFLFFVARMFVRVLFDLKCHRKLLPGPKGWPVVGAIPLLGSMPHVALARMAKKYGPVMYLKMGTCGMVVASTPNTARAFLKTLDKSFSNRPPNAAATNTIYHSKDLVFADYGPRWKLMRKLCNMHMLGVKAIEGWVRVRELEAGHMLRAMWEDSNQGKPVVVPEMLTYAMANMIGQAILSRRVFESKGSESNEFKDMVVELMTVAGHFNIGDYIPSIEWMDLQGIGRRLSKLVKKFDILITKMMEQHAAIAGHDKEKSDLLDFLMANAELSEGEQLTEMNIKALILNLFAAGTDTSSSTIEWALAEMLKNPKIFGKAHEEMDRVIGRDRRFQESDIPKLPYLQAICKEAMRMHPSTPLNLPRISTEPCMVGGYYIPEGTRLSVNIWAIGRDPEVWENPLEFTPERFLDGRFSMIEPQGNDFELIPFGAGRRMCVGARMGIVMVQYILGTLVHSFEWKLSSHAGELNMDETFGLTLQKAVPLSALVSPRLSPNAYDI